MWSLLTSLFCNSNNTSAHLGFKHVKDVGFEGARHYVEAHGFWKDQCLSLCAVTPLKVCLFVLSLLSGLNYCFLQWNTICLYVWSDWFLPWILCGLLKMGKFLVCHSCCEAERKYDTASWVKMWKTLPWAVQIQRAIIMSYEANLC